VTFRDSWTFETSAEIVMMPVSKFTALFEILDFAVS